MIAFSAALSQKDKQACPSILEHVDSSFSSDVGRSLHSETSVTDPWSRMISYHFLNETTPSNFFTNDSAHGAGQLWSGVPSLPTYKQALAPFPLIVFDSIPAGSNVTYPIPLQPVVYEVSVAISHDERSNDIHSLLLKISPLEFGSYDPSLSAMVNLTYVGTSLLNGQPANASACVTGFDESGFVMGTSSSLFSVSTH
jgi:lysophospholipase